LPDVSPKDVLLHLLKGAILKGKPDGVVLSGGIDSSLLAALAPRGMLNLGVTAVFGGSDARDRAYSKMVAGRLGIRHVIVEYGIDEAANAAREIVRSMRTFDHVEIRNDITIYLAMKLCREEGIACAMTGDGGDELFAGYEYMLRMDEHELSSYINSLSGKWTFSANRIGAQLGVGVSQPYLDPEVVEFARNLPYGWRVHKSGKTLGKWVLRSLLEELGFPEIAYRRKEPIELGSGSESISRLLNEALGEGADEIVTEALDDGVRFWSREQAYFYKIFKEIFGRVPRPFPGESSCACCGAPLDANRVVCSYCGFNNWDKG
jgi:asparagine synthase (glutamine-hydrolysing)